MFNNRRLFICSCIALVTSAFTFSLHGDVMQEMGDTFNFKQQRNGEIGQAIFYGMAISMLFGGFICDFLGIKRIMFLALVSHLSGTLGMVFSKNMAFSSSDDAYWWLYVSGLLMGFGNGFTEVGINPLVATLYHKQKTHFLNILHAWWPGGLVIGGLLAVFMRKVVFSTGTEANDLIAGFEYWQCCLLLIVIPALVYGFILIGSIFPATERVESGVSTGEMFGQVFRPMFLLWAFCMLLTAATELGPQKWQNSVMTSLLDQASAGTLILVYTSGMMFVLRHFAGPIAHRLSPVGMLTGSALLSAVGLYLLSYADSVATAFAYATIYGLGIAYFWPTMLGVAAERFPKGGALILALMGSAGNVSIALVLPQMGKIVDHHQVEYIVAHHEELGSTTPAAILKKEKGKFTALNADAVKQLPENSAAASVVRSAERIGFSMAFRWVSILPAALIFIFGGIALYDKARGGYQPEILAGRIDPEKLSGGVEGPIQ